MWNFTHLPSSQIPLIGQADVAQPGLLVIVSSFRETFANDSPCPASYSVRGELRSPDTVMSLILSSEIASALRMRPPLTL